MRAAEPWELTLAEAAAALRARTLSPVELTSAVLQRIEHLDAGINAFITVTADRALAQARRAERDIAAGRHRGPLHGIPYGLKDVYNTAGLRTTGHSKVGADHVPQDDSAVAARLEAAGGVLVGKLATYQFTHGGPSFDPPWPPARNPWSREHDAGGSSSGSAAAVAAGFVTAAMGTDTGGSVRIPASFCGVVGLKPTFGLVSRYGVIPNSFSFDHCGPLARTVEDCALLLSIIAGFDPRDEASVDVGVPDYRAELTRDIKGVRIGVLRHFWEEDLALSAEVARAMDDAIAVFRDLGAQVADARMRPLQDYYEVKNVITKAEVFCVHEQDLRARRDDFGPDFLGMTLGGCLFGAVDYVNAQRERALMLAEAQALYDRFDVLVTANVGPAPPLARKPPLALWHATTAPSSMCIPFSITGGPALSICNGFAASGLPLGMQIAARPFADGAVLRVAHAYERATAWHTLRPTLERAAPPGPIDERAGSRYSPQPDRRDDLCEWIALRALGGLDPEQLAQLQAVAPAVLAMGARLRRDRAHDVEIANASVPRALLD